MDMAEIIAANRDSWNLIAPRRQGAAPEFYRGGGTALAPIELELAGDVVGRRVLQLACSTGDEVISWTLAGAIACGVDISEVHIGTARAKAAAVGVACDLRVGDMYDLAADLVDLDLMYISWGGICWAPDLKLWARIVAERLRPGGAVLISEHHPLWESLSVVGENSLTVRADYFESGAIRPTRDPAKAPIGGRDADAPPFRSFLWSVGSVVTALLDAGLRIDALREAPVPEMYDGLGEAAAALPAVYYLKATRAGGGSRIRA
jgi:SAM-dependent methyltransferase